MRKRILLLCVLLPTLFTVSACGTNEKNGDSGHSSVIENSSEEAPPVGSMGTSGLLSVKETYALGEEFSVPACYVEVDGADVKMSHTVYYPDGRMSGYDTVTLDVLGTYKVKYAYQDKTEEISFNVESADIDSLFTSVSNAKITANTNGQDWNDYEMNGVDVYVIGATGAEIEGTFRYNEMISLRGKTKNDAFIEFIGNSEGDTYAYGTVTITLTDAYDPNNYIVIEVRDGAHLAGDECGHATYVTAQANGMYTKMGYSQNRGMVHEHGTELEASASGKRYEKRTTTNSIRLSYDANENALYGNVGPEANTPIKILDFDDKNMVDERYLWEGFSADMVYMSATIKTRFQSDEGRILITSLNGTSMSGKKSEVNDIRFDVDSLGYSKDALPNGLVGATYPAFNTTAYDNYGRELGEASLKVLDPDGLSVSRVNGRFRTDKEGDYTLIYSYETQTETGIFADTETLTVSVKEKAAELDCTILNPVSQDAVYKIGDKIVLSDCGVTGNIGNATVAPVVTLDGVPVETVTCQGKEYFYVDGVGDYTIAYVVTDFLGNTVTVKDCFNVAQDNIPVIELPEIGKIAVKGNTVEVPLVNAYTYYRGGKQSVPVKVYFDDEEITNAMSFTPDTVGSCELKYVAEYNGAITTESVLIKVVEQTEETPFIEGYMYLDGFEQTYTDGDYYLEAAAENARAQFALPIKQNFLGVTLSAGTWNFDNLYVTFTDNVNPREKVELRLATYMLGGKVSMALWINGTLTYSIEDFGDDAENTRLREISLCYDPETKELNDGRGNVMGKITTNYEGAPFNGFGSGYAYVDIYVDGATPKTEETVGSLLKLLKISEHTVSSNTEDRTPPSFILASDFGTLFTVKKGDSFKVKDVWAYDVFSKKCTLNLQILAPDGTAVYSGEYVRGYSFTTEQLGQYTVIYIALDANNRKATKTVKVSVQEFGTPDMSVDAPASTAKVGDKVTFAEAEYDEENVSVYVYVVRPNGARVTLETNMEKDGALQYTYLEAGTHYIRYVAVDEFMNVYVKEFAVEVK